MSEYNGTLYAAAPPAGVSVDPNAPYDATRLVAVIAIFLPLALSAMIVRTYTRAAIVGNVMLDDYLMFAAMALSVAMTGLVLDMLKYGLGKHLWNVPVAALYPSWQLDNLVAAVLFCAATGLAKGSILLFYLRIFPDQAMRRATWAVFAFVIAYSAASVLVNVFSCSPIAGSWELEASLTATCINRPFFYFAQASLGIFADLATVLLPVPRLKIGVTLILTLGAFVCVVSIVRLQSIYILLTDTDLTVNTVTALMWCVVELNLSIIGGSIPALKPFVQRFFPALLGVSTRRTGRSHTTTSGGGALVHGGHAHLPSEASAQLKLKESSSRSGGGGGGVSTCEACGAPCAPPASLASGGGSGKHTTTNISSTSKKSKDNKREKKESKESKTSSTRSHGRPAGMHTCGGPLNLHLAKSSRSTQKQQHAVPSTTPAPPPVLVLNNNNNNTTSSAGRTQALPVAHLHAHPGSPDLDPLVAVPDASGLGLSRAGSHESEEYIMMQDNINNDGHNNNDSSNSNSHGNKNNSNSNKNNNMITKTVHYGYVVERRDDVRDAEEGQATFARPLRHV